MDFFTNNKYSVLSSVLPSPEKFNQFFCLIHLQLSMWVQNFSEYPFLKFSNGYDFLNQTIAISLDL